VRSRDYCTSGKHIIAMSLSVIRIGVAMRNFMHVTNFVGKAEQVRGAAAAGALGRQGVG
jgi:COP9 signalosome complex subunit 1